MTTFTETEQKILRLARTYIDEPHKWTTHYLAKNAEGEFCNPESPQAVSFCAMGAILRATDIIYSKELGVTALTDKLGHSIPEATRGEYDDGWNDIAHFNNTSTHEEVLNLFDRALA